MSNFITRMFNNTFNVNKRDINQELIEQVNAISLPFGEMYINGSAMNLSTIYAAIELISNSISALPIHVFRLKNDGEKEIVLNHPIYLALHESQISYYNLMKQLVVDMYLSGNGYCYIKRTSNNTISDLVYLQPNEVQCMYNEKSRDLYYVCNTISNKKIMPKDMIHIVKNTRNGVLGVSILSYGKNIISLAQTTEQQAKNWFSSGSALNGVIKVNGPLDQKLERDYLERWRRTYGSGNNGGVCILKGNVDYQSISTDAKSAQMLESRQYEVEELARLFNIHPSLLGSTSKTSFGTIEQSKILFMSSVLEPIIRIIELEFERKMLNDDERGKYEINIIEKAYLKGDKVSEANYYNSLVQNGLITVNEARHELGFGRIDTEGADELHIAYSDIALNSFALNSNSNSDNNNKDDLDNNNDINK